VEERVEHWVVGEVLRRQAEQRGAAPFLQMSGGAPASFAEVDAQANRLARGLGRLGVASGELVAVMLPNSIEYCLVWFALNRLGAVHVAVNTEYKGEFLRHVLADAGCRRIICHRAYLGRLAAIGQELPALVEVIVTGAGDLVADELATGPVATAGAVTGEPESAGPGGAPASATGGAPGGRTSAGLSGAARPALSGVQWLQLEECFDRSAEPLECAVTYRDISTIMYTSGTTGPSKGVLMPHAHNYLLGRGIVDHLGVSERDTYYVCMPLFHANAMFMQVYASLIAGARVVLAPRFRASRWLDEVRAGGATLTHTIGVMTDFLLRQPERPVDRLNQLRAILAVPNAPALAPVFQRRFAVPVMIEGYGMTEVNMPLYMPVDGPPRPGSCGRVYGRYFEVRIADPETDEELPPGAVGEILVRPRQPYAFSAGYHRLPERTVAAWRNFWFHTGDAGRRDADGYFYYVDRLKDCIRCRGENVSSFEVEAALLHHPAVAEVAAIAVPSPAAGGEDEVMVCVVRTPGAELGAAELLDFCQERMPRFAVPRYVDFLDRLPRTPTEKVQKALLRARGITATTWDREAAGYRLRR
jgi:crotonobetaine/carnitine-CoA ligase